MPSPRRSTYRKPRTIYTDLAGLRRDGFFHDLAKLGGLGGAVGLAVVGLWGAALGVVGLFDLIY